MWAKVKMPAAPPWSCPSNRTRPSAQSTPALGRDVGHAQACASEMLPVRAVGLAGAPEAH